MYLVHNSDFYIETIYSDKRNDTVGLNYITSVSHITGIYIHACGDFIGINESLRITRRLKMDIGRYSNYSVKR